MGSDWRSPLQGKKALAPAERLCAVLPGVSKALKSLFFMQKRSNQEQEGAAATWLALLRGGTLAGDNLWALLSVV